jgi:hypothetical protein
MRSKAHTALTAPLVLHRTMKKLYINGQWRKKLFLIVIYRFSLVKAAVNAPRVCKFRKNCLTSIGKCAMRLSKKKKIGAFMTVYCGMKKKIPSALRIHPSHLNW